jgi:hypothetical protein
MCLRGYCRIWMGVVVLLASGCSAQKPEKKLVGSWVGAPSVTESVDEAVNAAGQGQKVNPLARGAAQFFGQKLAEATMSVEIDFRSGGAVFFRGNTSVLGLPPDSDGTWEVTSSGPDSIEIRFGTEAKQLEGKVLFRNKDEFTLKLSPVHAPAPETQGKEASKPPASSIVFKRNKN